MDGGNQRKRRAQGRGGCVTRFRLVASDQMRSLRIQVGGDLIRVAVDALKEAAASRAKS